MNDRNVRALRLRKIPILLVFVAIHLVPGINAWAQGWAMNDAPQQSVYESSKEASVSVYDASTQAAEKPKIKSLDVEGFSAYAVDICKKYDLDGPTRIAGPLEQTQLYQKLSETRKLLFTRLCDPEVRKDETLKAKFQSQIKSLTQDIRTFPSLNGLEVVPLPKDAHVAGKMVNEKNAHGVQRK